MSDVTIQTEAAPVAPHPLTGDPAQILEAALEGLEAEPAQNDAAPAAEPTNDAASEAIPEPAKAPPATDTEPEEDFVVSPAKPWTPERAKKAHERQEQQHRQLDKRAIILKKREDKQERRAAEVKAESERNDLIHKQLAASLAGLRHARGKELLDVLGRITERSGPEVYEELSYAMLDQKKVDPRDAVIARLEEKVEKLVSKLDGQDSERNEQAQAAQLRSEIRSIVSAKDWWPTIAELTAADPVQGATDFEHLYVNHCRKLGRWIDVEDFANRLELHLRKENGRSRTENGVPASPEADRDIRASAKPGSVAHGAPGKSLSPSLAHESGGSRRELTEQERVAELANDPDFLRDLGLSL